MTSGAETEPLLKVQSSATLRGPWGSQVIFGGGGTLSIFPSEVHWTPNRLSRFLSRQTDVAHVSHRVVVVHGRFLPPWMRHHLSLEDGRTTASVNLTRIRQQVVEALRLAGFEVEFQEAWLAMTSGHSRS